MSSKEGERRPEIRTVTGVLQFYYETGVGNHPVVSNETDKAPGSNFLDSAYYLEPGDRLTFFKNDSTGKERIIGELVMEKRYPQTAREVAIVESLAKTADGNPVSAKNFTNMVRSQPEVRLKTTHGTWHESVVELSKQFDNPKG